MSSQMPPGPPSPQTPASPQLDITWDAAKAASNLAKHGVSFAQASTVLLDALALTVFDAAHSEFEERWFTLGTSSTGSLLAVSHTYQHTGPIHVKVRLISARPATRAERKQYENEPR
ncbi:MAG: BrnT family toxin [Burkholderiaceae bacterium]